MEVCIDNIESAVNAQNGGAMRIELCSSLNEGGLTPSVGFLKVVKSLTKIPIFVMIRPRGGNFVYSEEEIQIMIEDIKALKQNGADGFVFGILTENGEVDVTNCLKLLKHTNGFPSTFHRAFDEVTSPMKNLEDIISLGFSRILTSGLKPTAVEGLPLIKELIKTAKSRITIMPGSGIKEDNIEQIIKETKVKEFHGSAKVKKGSYNITSEDIVKEMLSIYHSNVGNQ